MGMGLEENQHYLTRQLPQRRPLEFPQANEVLIPLDSAGEANSTSKEESSEFEFDIPTFIGYLTLSFPKNTITLRVDTGNSIYIVSR